MSLSLPLLQVWTSVCDFLNMAIASLFLFRRVGWSKAGFNQEEGGMRVNKPIVGAGHENRSWMRSSCMSEQLVLSGRKSFGGFFCSDPIPGFWTIEDV